MGAELRSKWENLAWTVPMLSMHTHIPESVLEAIARGDSFNLTVNQIHELAPAISHFQARGEVERITRMLTSLAGYDSHA
jgi:hypothetical protein